MPDFLFKRIFRMTRTTVESLLQEMAEFLPIGRSVNGKSLKPPERLLMFLKFLGSNERYIGNTIF